MAYNKIACFDVYYREDCAVACSVVFAMEPRERIIAEYRSVVKRVSEYRPGEFYKRELPCLLSVYESIGEKIDLIIVDGYVYLGNGRKGLGWHFFTALDKRIPVVGVAKTYFKGNNDYLKVYRGKSNRPLYVSSVGIELNYSADLIRKLKGKNRIPDVLGRVDLLSRVDRAELLTE